MPCRTKSRLQAATLPLMEEQVAVLPTSADVGGPPIPSMQQGGAGPAAQLEQAVPVAGGQSTRPSTRSQPGSQPQQATAAGAAAAAAPEARPQGQGPSTSGALQAAGHANGASVQEVAGEAAAGALGVGSEAIASLATLSQIDLTTPHVDLSRARGYRNAVDLLATLHPNLHRPLSESWMQPMYPMVYPLPDAATIKAQLEIQGAPIARADGESRGPAVARQLAVGSAVEAVGFETQLEFATQAF